MNENPYRTPVVDVSNGRYDYSLVKRVLFYTTMLGVVYAIIFTLSSWNNFSKAECIRSMPMSDQIRAFVTDWNYRP